MDLHLFGGRVQLEMLAVIRDLREVILFKMVDGVGQCHVATLVVMSVSFTIGCNVQKLIAGSFIESAQQPIGKNFSVVKQTFKSDRF